MELKFVKRPGNRNWGKMISPQPIVPTEFEVQAILETLAEGLRRIR